jgi:hypothetical protein
MGDAKQTSLNFSPGKSRPETHSSSFFLKRGQKNCPNLLIKKKKFVQFINEKPNKTVTTKL